MTGFTMEGRPFVPEPSWDMANLLADAKSALSVFGHSLSRNPFRDSISRMLVLKEAMLSCSIEGTSSSFGEVISGTGEDEVSKLARATWHAASRLRETPLGNDLIREAHAMLMAEGKGPGEFRTAQVRIGGAAHIPPSPEDVPRAMGDLGKYVSSDDGLDPLVRAALVHFQFETIHPFSDGNGRTGRLLTTLFLMEKGALSSPAFCLSLYLRANRDEYYDRLDAVRNNGNREQWVMFFLRAIEVSAKDSLATLDKLSALHGKSIEIISSMGRASGNTTLVFSHLEANPILDIGKTARALGLSFNTVSSAVGRLVGAGILKPTPSARNRTFSYEAYLDILREGTNLK